MSGRDSTWLKQEESGDAFPPLKSKPQRKGDEFEVNIIVHTEKKVCNFFQAELKCGSTKENCLAAVVAKADAKKFYEVLSSCDHKNILPVRGIWSCGDGDDYWVAYDNMVMGDLRSIKDKLFSVAGTSTTSTTTPLLMLTSVGQKVFRDLADLSFYFEQKSSGEVLGFPQLQFTAEDIYYYEDNSGDFNVYVGVCPRGTSQVNYSNRLGVLIEELAGTNLQYELRILVDLLKKGDLSYSNYLWQPAFWDLKKRFALILAMYGKVTTITEHRNVFLRDTLELLIDAEIEDLDRILEETGYMVHICEAAEQLEFKEEEFNINEW